MNAIEKQKDSTKFSHLILSLNPRLVPSVGLRERLGNDRLADSQFQPFMSRRNPVRGEVNDGNKILGRGEHHSPQHIANNVSDDDSSSFLRNHIECQGEKEKGNGLSLLPRNHRRGIKTRGFLLQQRNLLLQLHGLPVRRRQLADLPLFLLNAFFRFNSFFWFDGFLRFKGCGRRRQFGRFVARVL